jgi:hypothetical protein
MLQQLQLDNSPPVGRHHCPNNGQTRIPLIGSSAKPEVQNKSPPAGFLVLSMVEQKTSNHSPAQPMVKYESL